MFRVQVLISSIVVLWTTFAICEKCLYQDELWHAKDSNPKAFLYCDAKTNRAAVGACPTGTGFVRNQTVSGCIPWKDWSDSCITKTNAAKFNCKKNNSQKLHPALDPEYYFLCTKPKGQAVLLKCPDGKAFYSKNNYLGCFKWDMWRNITGCSK